MSGPPYPRYVFGAGPGQNAIGSFIIGVSPVGTVSPFDPWATVISQYANSPILDGLVTSFNDAMDLTQDLDNFYDLIWNVKTAQGYGLDVWGRIVNVPRTLTIPGATTFFGFEEAGAGVTGFGQGGFFSGGGGTPNYVLADGDYRTLIFAKMASNICDGSIPAINQILMTLFPHSGNCYVADGLNMTLTYHFQFALSPIQLAIVQQANVLPNPCGVVINVATP